MLYQRWVNREKTRCPNLVSLWEGGWNFTIMFQEAEVLTALGEVGEAEGAEGVCMS